LNPGRTNTRPPDVNGETTGAKRRRQRTMADDKGRVGDKGRAGDKGRVGEGQVIEGQVIERRHASP
jgi:hypothetical protein